MHPTSAMPNLLGFLLAVALLPFRSFAQDERITWLPRSTPAAFNLTATVTFSPEAPADTHALYLLTSDGGPEHRIAFTPKRASVVTVSDGKESPPATSEYAAPDGGRAHRLLVKRRPRSITVYVDGVRLIRVACAPDSAPRGRVGHAASSALSRLERPLVQPVGPVRFADDFMRLPGEMGAWQTVAGEWTIASLGLPEFSANAFCFRGRGSPAYCLAGQWFWENYRFSTAIRLSTAEGECGIMTHVHAPDRWLLFRWAAGRLELIEREHGAERRLAAHPCRLAPGQWYTLSVSAWNGQVACYIDGALALGPVSCSSDHGQVGLWAAGAGEVYVDDIQAGDIQRLEPPPLAKREAHVKAVFANDKYMQNWSRQASKGGGRVLDYTFHRAPADWSIAAGQWGIQSRWVCQPRWTWFGGSHDRAAIVWHKYRLRGDIDAAIYAAFRMDSPFDPVYRHPGDMAVTICADGRNLSSGYTFIFAGWENRWTRLLRKDTIVAETDAQFLPDNRDTFPYSKLHAPWYGLRLTKQGSRIECLVGEQSVLSYDDPTPLSGDRLAIWTWDNSLLLARTTITASDILPPDLSDYAESVPQEQPKANRTLPDRAGPLSELIPARA